MNISEYGLKFIMNEEGFVPLAYKDYTQWSVGYGSGLYSSGEKVKEGDRVTKQQASEMLHYHISRIVEPSINKHVKVKLSQNQYDALCSFIYNVGNVAFEKSTLLKLLNQSKYEEASNQFDVWVNAGGKKLSVLVNRREREKRLWKSC